MAATEPIRDKGQLKALGEYFLKRGQFRNYTLIVMGACTALRISDLLRLKWSDVYDEQQRTFRTHVTLTEKKTGNHAFVASGSGADSIACIFAENVSLVMRLTSLLLVVVFSFC